MLALKKLFPHMQRVDRSPIVPQESIIGSGSFGVVYRSAEKIVTKRVFYRSKEALLCTGLNEVAATCRVKGFDHWVTLLDVRVWEMDQVIEMDLVDGGKSLKQRLDQKKGYLSNQEVMRLVRHMALALKYLHDEVKLMHTDVKPANILVGKDRQYRLADLGGARIIGDVATILIQPPKYRAPEVTKYVHDKSNEKYNEKIDIWSLGIVICVVTKDGTALPEKIREIHCQMLEQFPSNRISASKIVQQLSDSQKLEGKRLF